jgi:hypothetical protein
MMKESSSLCDSAADGNWGLRYKRKRSKLKVSPSNENEATSPTSDSPMSHGSTKKKLKHDTKISPSVKKIRGHDGVSFSSHTFSILSYLIVFHADVIWDVLFHVYLNMNKGTRIKQ